MGVLCLCVACVLRLCVDSDARCKRPSTRPMILLGGTTTFTYALVHALCTARNALYTNL